MAVELYILDKLVELEGTENISTDYAIAEIGNFSTRKGFRSINFDLPITANNKAILENAELVNNSTTRPYRRLKARVFVDGIDQNIRFCNIESSQDTYNVRLYGGNANFFEIIKGKQIRELQYLPTLNHEFNLTNVYDSRQNTDGYIYPLIDWHADSPNTIMSNTSKTFDVRYCYPCLFVNDIIENICIDAGYSLSNNLLNDLNYQSADLIFPIFNAEPDAVSGDATFSGSNVSIFNKTGITFDRTYNLITFDDINGYQTDAITGTFTSDGALSGEPLDPFTGTLTVYEIPYKGVYTFTFNISGIKQITDEAIAIIYFLNGTVLEELARSVTVPSVTSFDLTATFTTEFPVGAQIGCIVVNAELPPATPPVTVETARFDVKSIDLKIQIGRDLLFQFMQIKFKQSDFLRAYLQMFCCLVTVDEDTKTVYINKFDDIANNIPLAIDWTDKIDYTDKPNVEYSLESYAKSNTLTYKEDDSIDPTFIQGSNGTIIIDDETLDATNEFVELPFSATEMDSRLQAFVIPKIKIFRTDDASPPETKPTDKVEPRILLLERVTTVPSVIYSDGSSTLTTNVDLPLPWFMLGGKQLNLGFANNLIPLYYTTLQDVLNRTKVLTINVKLNAIDIYQLDFLKPVFIAEHNAYFYISKISGFTYGSSESTEVELVKLR
jgi:hypothetical protein